MLRQLDTTLRQNYHQSLVEILNELRMRSVVSQPDPSPDKVFSVILETHMLSFKPSSRSIRQMREALERLTRGQYGLCVCCGREIPADALVRDPTTLFCRRCSTRAND